MNGVVTVVGKVIVNAVQPVEMEYRRGRESVYGEVTVQEKLVRLKAAIFYHAHVSLIDITKNK